MAEKIIHRLENPADASGESGFCKAGTDILQEIPRVFGISTMEENL